MAEVRPESLIAGGDYAMPLVRLEEAGVSSFGAHLKMQSAQYSARRTLEEAPISTPKKVEERCRAIPRSGHVVSRSLSAAAL